MPSFYEYMLKVVVLLALLAAPAAFAQSPPARSIARSANVADTRDVKIISPAEDPPLVVSDSVRALFLVAGRAVVDSALATARDTAPVCVSFANGSTHYRPELSDLRQLADLRRRYIPRTQCPRTYTSMISAVDSLGRPIDPPPLGSVDPHYLQFTVPGRWTNDRLDIDVRIVQGTASDTYLCFTRFRASGPVAACRLVSRSVS